MTGDITDIVSRLLAVLPRKWFPNPGPNILGLLEAIATPWVWVYQLITYVTVQNRISTATDIWLDLVAYDFFGRAFARRSNEGDLSYRSRIKASLLGRAATRASIISGIESLTGAPPFIFEPGNPMDTGCYGKSTASGNQNACGLSYGLVGGWGSLDLPLQFFIAASRPSVSGVGSLPGYNTSPAAYTVDTTAYANLNSLPSHITDQNIQKTLASLLPINTIAWLRIT